MAYTQSDLDAVTQTIIALQSGRTIQEVETPGKRVKYATMSLGDLLRLQGVIMAEVSGASSGGMFNKASFNDPV